jgi:hypothetical protein
MTKEEIKQKLREAIEHSQYKDMIAKVSLFGSYAHNDPPPRENSDVDVLIEFVPDSLIGAFEFIDLKDAIEKNLGKHVDLITTLGLSKFMRDDVLKYSEPTYEKK